MTIFLLVTIFILIVLSLAQVIAEIGVADGIVQLPE